MNYEKFFSAAALATLLSLSSTAFSEEPIGYEEDETSYYVRGQWNGEFFNIINSKELKYSQGNSFTGAGESLHSGKVDGTAVNHYRPTYKTPYTTGSAAVGYKMEDIRVELEGLYSKLDLDGDNNTFAANAAVESVKTLKKGDNHVATNSGVRNIAGMINVLYDVDLGMEEIPVTPYVGVGAGVSHVTFLNDTHLKPAYQAKAGISYAMTPEIKLHAGYRYFGFYGNDFPVKLETDAKTGTGASESKKPDQDITVRASAFGVHGLEAGVAFHF